ncbi:hypothetical protein OTK49_03120 [Vibrio coralliirubri]|uniref:hypothetical protein n=1 Tax=Vibrio coralliirubri TaxID=1516159 RepID=UPI002283F2EE|nr:hypothetical protein [Vibrio coralliirubri]MCY9861507.1 hypothetical protein [Vibrio coralliirubri]
MNNKLAKALIERVTPVPKDSYLPFNIFPWSHDCMCPLSAVSVQRDTRILLKLKRRLSNELYQHVVDVMEDSEGGYELEVVRSITCDADAFDGCLERDDQFGRYWIDERENGGYSGDSYSGYGYIKISSLDYLKFSYSI